MAWGRSAPRNNAGRRKDSRGVRPFAAGGKFEGDAGQASPTTKTGTEREGARPLSGPARFSFCKNGVFFLRTEATQAHKVEPGSQIEAQLAEVFLRGRILGADFAHANSEKPKLQASHPEIKKKT